MVFILYDHAGGRQSPGVSHWVSPVLSAVVLPSLGGLFQTPELLVLF